MNLIRFRKLILFITVLSTIPLYIMEYLKGLKNPVFSYDFMKSIDSNTLMMGSVATFAGSGIAAMGYALNNKPVPTLVKGAAVMAGITLIGSEAFKMYQAGSYIPTMKSLLGLGLGVGMWSALKLLPNYKEEFDSMGYLCRYRPYNRSGYGVFMNPERIALYQKRTSVAASAQAT